MKYFIFVSLSFFSAPSVTGWQWFGGGAAETPQNSAAVEQISQGQNSLVHVLETDTFENFVSEHGKVSAVFFTSPWCFVCQAILPLWAEAAKLVASSAGEGGSTRKIEFALIDVTKNPAVAEENHIHGFPTMKLFVDKEVFIYTHEAIQTPLTASVILNWVNRHANRSNEVSTADELKEFLSANSLVVLGVFDDSEDSRNAKHEFSHSANHFEDVFFVHLSGGELLPEFASIVQQPVISTYPTVVMVYDHDDKYAVFDGPISSIAIDAFVRGRRLLPVNVFQPGTIEYILDSGLPMLFLISGSADGSAAERKSSLEKIAREFIGRVVMVTVGSTQSWEQKLAELVGVTDPGNSSVLRILMHPEFAHHDHDPVSQSQTIIKHGIKYRPNPVEEPEVTEESIRAFVSAFLDGALEPYIRSEPLPADPKDSFTPGSILVEAVGTNFGKLVTDDIKRDVLVVYHAPWCGFCRKFMPTLRDLGIKLAHTGRSLKIVKIDASKNEIPGVSVSGYPTLVLYTAVDQRVPIHLRKAETYGGDRSIESLLEFLHEKCVNPFTDDAPPMVDDDSSQDGRSAYAFEEL